MRGYREKKQVILFVLEVSEDTEKMNRLGCDTEE